MPQRREKHQAERDERDVRHDEVDRLRKIDTLARVHPFHHHDARILAQLPVELALPDVDRVDPDGAALQQAVGEAAGGRADVERHATGDVEAQLI